MLRAFSLPKTSAPKEPPHHHPSRWEGPAGAQQGPVSCTTTTTTTTSSPPKAWVQHGQWDPNDPVLQSQGWGDPNPDPLQGRSGGDGGPKRVQSRSMNEQTGRGGQCRVGGCQVATGRSRRRGLAVCAGGGEGSVKEGGGGPFPPGRQRKRAWGGPFPSRRGSRAAGLPASDPPAAGTKKGGRGKGGSGGTPIAIAGSPGLGGGARGPGCTRGQRHRDQPLGGRAIGSPPPPARG